MTEDVELVEFAEAVNMLRRVVAPVVEVDRFERVEVVVVFVFVVADAAGCAGRRDELEVGGVRDGERRHVVADVAKAVGPEHADGAAEEALLVLRGGHLVSPDFRRGEIFLYRQKM